MRILITGGSGFLGRGLLRYAKDHWDPNNEYVVYSRDELKQDQCKQHYGQDNIKYVLGDVRDYDRLLTAITSNDVRMVIHTAAIKYIPQAEFNVQECIDVNVEGTRNVLKAAYVSCVNGHDMQVVGISTDKACAPINVYGMTKALMERLFGEYAAFGLYCSLARYGNVIGSTGSVIPKFKQQLSETGEITLTDPAMTRYWITIEEACRLVELAMTATSGSIIIPKPRSMLMAELAQALIDEYCNDADIRVIGKRPGEKMHEALLHAQESPRARDQHTCYELMHVGHIPSGDTFELSSEFPEGGWVTAQELTEAALDAELV